MVINEISINGKTKVFGLLANPIEHTISPFIHGLFFRVTGFNGTYNPYLVPADKLKDAIEGMKALSIEGLNVSVPYKVEVMEYLDSIDEMALHIGACNTIVRENGRLKGYNTDWIGLKMACDYGEIPITGKDIVIIGAGGSARAVAFMCQHEKAKSVLILNRTVAKADLIAEQIRKVNPGFLIQTGSLDAVESVVKGSVAIQTTSVGMHPMVKNCPIIEDDFFGKVDFIVDIIYNPKETNFITKGNEFKAKTMNGLGMLFFQAVKAFELWSDYKLSDKQIDTALTELENYVYTNKN